MKKVLIVTRVFPPMAAVGVYRVIKFCKFLPQHGWQPVVLTVRGGSNESFDPRLAEDLRDDLAVYRARNPEPFLWWERFRSRDAATATPMSGPRPVARNANNREAGASTGSPGLKQRLLYSLATPDQNAAWVPFAVGEGLKAVRREGIRAVVTTSPPPSTHLVGTWLSVLAGIPHVVDFRDLWTQGPRYHLIPRLPLARAFDRGLEKWVLSRSRWIVGATETFMRQLRTRNPGLDPQRMTAILNGLDPDDFRDVPFPDRRNDRFTILHLGSLYGLRDPAFFFEALERFLSEHPEAGPQMVVRFIGNVSQHQDKVRGTPLEKVVEFCGHRPHHTVLSELWAADMLLLILGFGASESGTIPAKLFEYLATGRPLLAFTPEGEASAMIDKVGDGTVITAPDHDAACRALAHGFREWQERQGPLESSLNIPEEFDRRRQAGQLAAALDACVDD